MQTRWGGGSTFKSIFMLDTEPEVFSFEKSLIFCECFIFLL